MEGLEFIEGRTKENMGVGKGHSRLGKWEISGDTRRFMRESYRHTWRG